MKPFLCLIALLVGPLMLAAQPVNGLVAGQRQPLQVIFSPVYQTLSVDDHRIIEASLPLSIYVPLGRHWGLGLHTAWAAAGGDEIASLSGLTDTQGALSYYRPLGNGSIVVGLGANLPSGKQELTPPEFATLAFLSRNAYDFQTPSFGLGFGISPSLTIAFPIGESFVIGVGSAYQIRGAFEPLENMPEAYKPGDEWLVTGGLDVRFSETILFTADVTRTIYQPDKVGGAEIFEAGTRLIAAAQFRYRSRRTASWVRARFRSRAKSTLAITDGTLAEEAVKRLPNQIEIFAGFRTRLGSLLTAGLLGELRLFEETPLVPDIQGVYGAGAELEVSLTQQVHVPARVLYHFGDITGVEAGLGLRLRL